MACSFGQWNYKRREIGVEILIDKCGCSAMLTYICKTQLVGETSSSRSEQVVHLTLLGKGCGY